MKQSLNEIGIMLGVGQNPVESIRKAKSLGIRLVQLGSPGDDYLVEPGKTRIKEMLAAAGIEVFAVFVAFEGESYEDIPTVRRTVGFLAPETRERRIERTFRTCDLARHLGASYAAAHVGFIPREPGHPQYAAMVEAVQRIADYAKSIGLSFALETGQEPADVLVRFIGDVRRENVFVNFDPANMILYGSGDPHDALAKLKRWVVSVHCKDGVGPTQKDRLGEEKPLGQGAVDIPRFIRELRFFGFTGPLFIEREISGPEQVKDIREAITLLENLRKS